jgi:hypothetical protein
MVMGVGDEELDARYRADRPRPVVRFDAIGEGWGLFQREVGVWILTALIVLLCNWAVQGFVFSLFEARHPRGARDVFRMPLPPGGHALQVVLTAAIDGFFLGGMFRMACRQVRGHRIAVGQLFSVTDVLPELILGSVLYAAICFVLGTLCVIPGLIAWGVLMFTIPLIVDGGLPATAALGQSWRALKDQWLMASVFHLLAWLITGIGLCFCFVGILLTGPLYTLSIAVLYRDFFLEKGDTYAAKPGPPFTDF